MTREIEFRAKAVTDHKWRYGYLTECDDFCLIDQRNECLIEGEYNFRGDTHWFEMAVAMCDKDTVGQYTGMKDKNGMKVYEGDIVLQRGYSGKAIPMKVRFDQGAFIVGYHTGSSTKKAPMLLNNKCEVIGNIFDNPELLNGDEKTKKQK